MPNGVTRTAKYVGSQGCVTLPIGKTDVIFTPVTVKSTLPDPKTQPWPMGDRAARHAAACRNVDAAKAAAGDGHRLRSRRLDRRVRRHLEGTHHRRAVRPDITPTTPLESWSMGKSLTATLMGMLIKQGVYDLWQPAPIPEWQTPGDARAKIRIVDILHMSSGLRIKAPQDPDFDPNGTYPDHLYLYTATHRLVQVRGDAAAAVAAQHRWPLPQHRSGAHQLPDPPRARQDARRTYHVVPAASAVRQDRHPHDGDGDRSLRELPDAGLRTRVGPRLGAASPTSICRTGCGTASASCPKAT